MVLTQVDLYGTIGLNQLGDMERCWLFAMLAFHGCSFISSETEYRTFHRQEITGRKVILRGKLTNADRTTGLCWNYLAEPFEVKTP